MSTNIGIIGTGRLGLSFAKALQSIENIVWLANTSGYSIDGFNSYSFEQLTLDQIAGVDIIAICTTDSEIESVVQTLVDTFGAMLSGKCLFHCSGAKSVTVLQPLATVGAFTVAMHPYQTFPFSDKHLITSIPWLVECEDESFHKIEPMLKLLDAKIVRSNRILTESERLQWHSTAVLCSNFTATLYQIASSIMNSIGIPNSFDFIGSISEQTVINAKNSLQDKGFIEMSGPIVRGDVEIVNNEIEALTTINPMYGELYSILSKATETVLNEQKRKLTN
jgi:predicted short-subunit dehydrogenase-like oxidoreductase (DUF2520 family)